ncbi:hypothetical protein CJJ09_001999 [Candidozyma auris]|nr:hypothetical protein CJJ09_001999 [[Candida] auris]
MGYPSELKPSIRKVADNVVTLSVPFTMMGIARTGGRMAIFRYGDEIIYWSPIPYGEYIEEAIDLLVSPRGSEKVTHLFVVNKEHNLVAKSYLEKYPDIKIVAGEKLLGRTQSIMSLSKSTAIRLSKEPMPRTSLRQREILEQFPVCVLVEPLSQGACAL